MLDCHVHLERGSYTLVWLEEFIKNAVKQGMDENYLLEHSHRFIEFIPMYNEICEYNDYQKEWFLRKNDKNLSIKSYTDFIEQARRLAYPIKLKFGLEVCYFEGYEELIKDITNSFPYDFITGSIHWVDGFGFDHKKELWDTMDVDYIYKRYYEIMINLIKTNLFTGLAHPDSIKAFGHKPSYDLSDTYYKLADLLNKHNMYAEQSGGLHLNYSKECELGMNEVMRSVFQEKGVRICTASDAHKPEDVGANIKELCNLLIDN